MGPKNGAETGRDLQMAQIESFLAVEDFGAAVGLLQELVEQDPEFRVGRFKLAYAQGRLDRFDEAVIHLRWLEDREPDRPSVLFALGKTEKELGNLDAAILRFKRLTERDETHLQGLAELGACLLAKKETRQAIFYFSRATRLDPNNPRLHYLLAVSQSKFDLTLESVASLEMAHSLDPANEEIAVQLTKQYLMAGEILKSESLCLQFLESDPSSVQLICYLATCRHRLGKTDEAEQCYQDALLRERRVANSYAEWLQEVGRFDAAADMLWGVLKEDPLNGETYYQLVNAKRYEVDGIPLIDQARLVYENPTLSRTSQMYLGYALGSLAEKGADFKSAMDYFDNANAAAWQIYNSGRVLDREAETRYATRTMGAFTSEVPRVKIQAGSQEPLLIVGMIRSGTTLLDQILSSHPDVTSAGELTFWTKTAEQFGPNWKLPDDKREFDKIAHSYLERLSLAGSTRWITDKMPTNYRYIGLIHLIFPEAKILHIRRNPIDTCLSIYTNHFGFSTRWVYDQSNIVFAYREYLAFMEHWRATLPPGILIEIAYEDIIEGGAAILRSVLAKAGIPWDDRCLAHELNSSSIRTPSRWQARQPLYKSSANRWKNFETYLGDLSELKNLLLPSELA